jgi:hypothetical protein
MWYFMRHAFERPIGNIAMGIEKGEQIICWRRVKFKKVPYLMI